MYIYIQWGNLGTLYTFGVGSDKTKQHSCESVCNKPPLHTHLVAK